jgi:hypothetical protein
MHRLAASLMSRDSRAPTAPGHWQAGPPQAGESWTSRRRMRCRPPRSAATKSSTQWRHHFFFHSQNPNDKCHVTISFAKTREEIQHHAEAQRTRRSAKEADGNVTGFFTTVALSASPAPSAPLREPPNRHHTARYRRAHPQPREPFPATMALCTIVTQTSNV